MPISPIVLQRRHAELGRIRLGNKVATNNGKTRPNKLSEFRFTSSSEEYIRALATLYGGEAREWMNGSKKEWEVFTTTRSIEVIVLKAGLSQWMETWSGGGCTHRCDGITNVLTDELCDPKDRDHVNAKPTTRLTVMLRDLEAIGGWRLETHGWNAAAEIPAIAELAQFVGEMVPAVLHLMERTSVKDGKTSQFVVPVLDLKIGSARLNEIVAAKMGQPLALASGEGPALPAGQPAALPSSASAVPNYLAQAQECSSLEGVQAIWHKARNAGHMTDQLNAELQILGNALAPAAPGPDADGAYPAEEVPPGDEAAAAAADIVWHRVLAEAGRQGLTTTQTTEEYAAYSGGEMAGQASAAQLEAFLVHLQGAGQQASA